MEKRKPHFLLRDIKAAFADPAKLNRSFASRQGAGGLGMDDQAVVNAIQALTTADFDKSMTSYANSQIWQDVLQTHGRQDPALREIYAR
jgi:motility quorum-sensing regulator / GCU-specific mRNA interferase toxin